MVKLRLRRTGTKNKACFRIVATDARSPRDGRFIEILGFYDPRHEDEKVDLERVDYWLSNGAQPSETVASIIDRARKGTGALKAEKKVVETKVTEEKAEEAPAKEAEAAAEEAPVEEAEAAAEEAPVEEAEAAAEEAPVEETEAAAEEAPVEETEAAAEEAPAEEAEAAAEEAPAEEAEKKEAAAE